MLMDNTGAQANEWKQFAKQGDCNTPACQYTDND